MKQFASAGDGGGDEGNEWIKVPVVKRVALSEYEDDSK